MKNIATITLVTFAFAGVTLAQQQPQDDTTTTAPAPQTTTAAPAPATTPDSPLVAAAKANAAKRKKASAKVITNDDIRRSGGHLSQPKAPLPALPPTIPGTDAVSVTKGLIAAKEEAHRSHVEATKKLEEAQKRVESLQLQLGHLEETYYDSGDPNERDGTIEKSFSEKQKELEQAKKDLETAKEAERRTAPEH